VGSARPPNLKTLNRHDGRAQTCEYSKYAAFAAPLVLEKPKKLSVNQCKSACTARRYRLYTAHEIQSTAWELVLPYLGGDFYGGCKLGQRR